MDVPDKSRLFNEFFRDGKIPEERERAWRDAVRHPESGTPSLRFSVYQDLYLFNVHAQAMIDLLEKISGFCGIAEGPLLYHQSLLQQVRASACSTALNHMTGIEDTEVWLLGQLSRADEKKDA